MIEIELATQVVSPGAQLTGRYTVDGRTVRAQVSLIWHTEGKGTDHREVLALVEHGDADLGPLGERRSGTFTFTLPGAPTSYSGNLLQIRWLVRVRAWSEGEHTELANASFVVGGASPPETWKIA